MKRIKTALASLMALVMIIACGQFIGVTEVQAASATITVYNAQYVSDVSAALKETFGDEVSNAQFYISNDATVVDVRINSSDTMVLYGLADVDAAGNGDPTYTESYTTSQRLNIGQDMKTYKSNEGVVACGVMYASDLDTYYVFITQKQATQLGLSVQGTSTDNSNCTMYRLYNPNSGEHFYTANVVEKNYLVSIGWSDEGTGWTAPACSGTPVYRVYNPNAGDHHYTTNVAEKNNLVALGWNDEGIGWYSDEAESSVLYRMYNPNCTGAGAHHYTTNYEEAKNLNNIGWRYEGHAWYGL